MVRIRLLYVHSLSIYLQGGVIPLALGPCLRVSSTHIFGVSSTHIFRIMRGGMQCAADHMASCTPTCRIGGSTLQPEKRVKSASVNFTYFYSTGVLRTTTSEPLPQRPMRKFQRLRRQELQQATPEKVVGSATTPPSGELFPSGEHTT